MGYKNMKKKSVVYNFECTMYNTEIANIMFVYYEDVDIQVDVCGAVAVLDAWVVGVLKESIM